MQKIDIGRSLIDETTHRIREAILSGELALGTKLSEQRLADMLGISRSPVSQALTILSTEGLVDIYPKRGSFVFVPDAKDVHELCEYRAVLETAAFALSYARSRRTLMDALTSAVEAMEAALAIGDRARYTLQDLAFHDALISNCANSRIKLAYDRSMGPILAIRAHVFSATSVNSDRSMQEHRDIVACCQKQRPGKAREILALHIQHLADEFQLSTRSNQETAGV
jgi:DNA-binding GntR family transcriptional regulator